MGIFSGFILLLVLIASTACETGGASFFFASLPHKKYEKHLSCEEAKKMCEKWPSDCDNANLKENCEK